jgi:hypothetical protein
LDLDLDFTLVDLRSWPEQENKLTEKKQVDTEVFFQNGNWPFEAASSFFSTDPT